MRRWTVALAIAAACASTAWAAPGPAGPLPEPGRIEAQPGKNVDVTLEATPQDDRSAQLKALLDAHLNAATEAEVTAQMDPTSKSLELTVDRSLGTATATVDAEQDWSDENLQRSLELRLKRPLFGPFELGVAADRNWTSQLTSNWLESDQALRTWADVHLPWGLSTRLQWQKDFDQVLGQENTTSSLKLDSPVGSLEGAVLKSSQDPENPSLRYTCRGKLGHSEVLLETIRQSGQLRELKAGYEYDLSGRVKVGADASRNWTPGEDLPVDEIEGNLRVVW